MSEAKLRNALRPGHTLHWYRIERVLGQGGFGITYLALDTNLEHEVAIKEYLPMDLAVREGDHSVYPVSQAQDERYKWGLDRFLAEARTLAKFRHPAIVRVLSVFEANNTAYMVMEYQQGLSLQQVLDRRRILPEDELRALVAPLLDGLEALHARGFIHRDIKPPNVFVRSDGQPVLLDFGSARQALGEQTRTLTSVVSPGYAPFEQYYSKSDRQGPWTDIYGLGATLYRCLSGRQPMAAIDRSEAILKAERDVFVTAAELGVGRYSDEFLAAVDCALAFNEKKRPQTIAEWRARFALGASHAPVPASTPASASEDDATTRFSAVLDDDGTVEDIFNSHAGERERVRRAEAQTGGRSAQPPQPRPASPRNNWPALLALSLLAALAAGAWFARDAAWLPELVVTGKEERAARRLIEQADRALAAGQIYLPEQTSALAFYLRAEQRDPGNVDAAQGIRAAATHVAGAVDEAIAAQDLPGATRLARLLDDVPRALFDTTSMTSVIAAAQARAQEREQQATRIEEFLAAATAAIEAGHLLGAGTDNAVAKYRAVQILDPHNAAAAAGLLQLGVLLAAQGQAALADDRIDEAARLHAQARMVNADAPEVAALAQDIERRRGEAGAAAARQAAQAQEMAADQARREHEAQALAAQRAADAAALEAEQRARADAQRASEEAERARVAAEQERRRRQDAEATRLFAEAQRKAAAEEQARLSEQQADAGAPRMLLDFHGFDPRFKNLLVSPERVMHEVVPMLRSAGYELVTRAAVHAAGNRWSNLKVVIYRLTVNENTATGLLSYAGSVNVFGPDAVALSLPQALASNAQWTRGHNGLGPSSDLRWMVDHFTKLTQEFIAEQPVR